MGEVNWELVKFKLECLAVADHIGDVNDSLPGLVEALGLAAEWDDERGRWVMAWEEWDEDE